MNGDSFNRISGLRAFYHDAQPEIIFINGEQYTLPDECAESAKQFCNEQVMTAKSLGNAIHHPAVLI